MRKVLTQRQVTPVYVHRTDINSHWRVLYIRLGTILVVLSFIGFLNLNDTSLFTSKLPFFPNEPKYKSVHRTRHDDTSIHDDDSYVTVTTPPTVQLNQRKETLERARSENKYNVKTIAPTRIIPSAKDKKNNNNNSNKDNNNNNINNNNNNNNNRNNNKVSGHQKSHKSNQNKRTTHNNQIDAAECSEWSPDFNKRFQDTCQPWIRKFGDWHSSMEANPGALPVAYACLSERLCHGVGDRFSGIFTALDHAMLQKRPLRVLWDGIEGVFKPSCMMKSSSWVASPDEIEDLATGCRIPQDDTKIVHHCAAWHGICRSAKKTVRFGNIIRACASNNICHEMVNSLEAVDTLDDDDELTLPFPGGTTAHLFGCPMRMLFQPQPSFLGQTLSFLLNGQAQDLRVTQIGEIMKDYFVISMHFRLGDRSFSEEDDSFHIDSGWDRFQPFFACADAIEQYAQATELAMGKPVRWMFASDSPFLRKKVLEIYGKRVMMVNQRPSHVARNNESGDAKSQTLRHTFAEWYLLSQGDTLLLNRYRRGPTLFRGRLSGFAKTLWTYQLKHLYYDAGTCSLRTMTVDGSWKPHNKYCARHQEIIEFASRRLPQPHMKYYTKPIVKHLANGESDSDVDDGTLPNDNRNDFDNNDGEDYDEDGDYN